MSGNYSNNPYPPSGNDGYEQNFAHPTLEEGWFDPETSQMKYDTPPPVLQKSYQDNYSQSGSGPSGQLSSTPGSFVAYSTQPQASPMYSGTQPSAGNYNTGTGYGNTGTGYSNTGAGSGTTGTGYESAPGTGSSRGYRPGGSFQPGAGVGFQQQQQPGHSLGQTSATGAQEKESSSGNSVRRHPRRSHHGSGKLVPLLPRPSRRGSGNAAPVAGSEQAPSQNYQQPASGTMGMNPGASSQAPVQSAWWHQAPTAAQGYPAPQVPGATGASGSSSAAVVPNTRLGDLALAHDVGKAQSQPPWDPSLTWLSDKVVEYTDRNRNNDIDHGRPTFYNVAKYLRALYPDYADMLTTDQVRWEYIRREAAAGRIGH